MQTLGAGYSHSSLLVDVPLTVNQKSAAELIQILATNAKNVPTVEMRQYLLGENLVWRSPNSVIRSLKLPNFNAQKWMATSRREYSTENQKANQTPLYEVLLLYMIQYTPAIKADSSTAVLFLGDYDEILKPVEVVISPDFQHRFLEWKAFVGDPYNPNQVNLSEIFPLYDQYLGDKWLVGPDTSGMPSDVNLQWLNTRVKSTVQPRLVLAARSRLDYLQDDFDSLKRQYQSCLALLAACQVGSTAVLKITLPTVNGIYAIYALFSLFFGRVRLVKTRHSTPDDSTAFLVGVEAQPIGQEVLNGLLGDDAMLKTLAILASNTNRQLDNDLNRLLKDPTDTHIDALFRL